MPARRILVAYGTRYGHTALVASRIADLLAEGGDLVTLVPAGDLPIDFSPRDYDAIVLGASIIGGRYQRSARRFATRYGDDLNTMPSAFFSVSASAASADEAGREAAWQVIRRFLADAQWNPRLVESIAGAIAYTKYSFFVRWMLRRISAKAGGPTDTSRDHVLTDWAQVERFARGVARMVPRRAAKSVLEMAGS